jgi:hypothetical protein
LFKDKIDIEEVYDNFQMLSGGPKEEA